MREIGRVKLVQVHPAPLKVGRHPNAYYDPSPLLVVDTLLVSPYGAIGVTESESSLKKGTGLAELLYYLLYIEHGHEHTRGCQQIESEDLAIQFAQQLIVVTSGLLYSDIKSPLFTGWGRNATGTQAVSPVA